MQPPPRRPTLGPVPPQSVQAQNVALEAPSLGKRPGPWPPRMESLPPGHGHNVEILKSWARRTGYKSTVSGETTASKSDAEISRAFSKEHDAADRGQKDHQPNTASQSNETMENQKVKVSNTGAPHPAAPAVGTVKKALNSNMGAPNSASPVIATEKKALNSNHRVATPQIRPEPFRGSKESETDMMSQSQDPDDAFLAKHSHMKYEIRDNPGVVPMILYGLQHYLSIAGSIVLIPLVIVPAMGGSDEETAQVVSTVFMVTGLATLMHTFFGSRLPIIQGASFVYLAPALTIINSREFLSIGTDRFKHTMRELQGAVIAASALQVFFGYSGLMSILLRLINPVVVTPTVAAVGLAFFTYGFPVVGSCAEIGIPQIFVVLLFALYLRKISILGHRIFQVYAVPLGLAIVWAYAFLLTAAGAYNYKGCNANVPSSNIISESCRKHVLTMIHCRTDMSDAFRTAAWFRFPYPFQWGIPTFQWKTVAVMMVASVVASIDSVGTYHASSLLVAARPPTPGIVSRAIGLEGLASILAGLWGIGTGATTLTENVHTIAVTKMGSRRAIEFGACILIMMSVVGKIGAFIATIPQVLVAALLCVMWTLLTALGLSNLRYSETGSSRNVIIVGSSLFLSLSIPAYFQHYATGARSAIVVSYLQPYTVAAHGPVRTGFEGLDFFLNTTLSMNMAIAFLVAFVLDNTVPGSQHERGTYVWTKPTTARRELAVVKDYSLPPKLAKYFTWARWVGL